MFSRSIFAAAFVLVVAPLFLGSCCTGDSCPIAPEEEAAQIETLDAREVEAGCAMCQLGVPGGGCELAVRFDGATYLVDGSAIDDHGDAHAPDGLCNAVRRARVSGSVKGERLAATSFELLPSTTD